MHTLDSIMPILEAIISFIDEGVIIAEADGPVIYHNPAAAELLPMPANEPIADLRALPGIELQSLLTKNRDAAAGDFVRLRRRLDHRDGERVLEFHAGLLPLDEPGRAGPAKRLRLVIISDHTERERLEAVLGTDDMAHFVSRDPIMLELLQRVRQIAPTDAFVLLQGESGTGKTQLARGIHDLSQRSDRPFVEVNCAAIPESLIESELFGHVKGAFTGAHQDRGGRFQAADGGTLFLDEIGEIPLPLQAKLLRAVQDQAFEMVGSDRTLQVDVRVISASNRNLRDQVDEGLFRSDLYYRLAVIPLRVPPLRERRGDIPLLIEHFYTRLRHRGYAGSIRFDDKALGLMMDYAWPGNVRELENAVEHGVICAIEGCVSDRSLPQDIRQAQTPTEAFTPARSARTEHPSASAEKARIQSALQRHHGHRRRAATELGIDRTTLWRRMRRYGLA